MVAAASFFENPSLLVGVPLLVIGLIGLGVAAMALLAPAPAAEGRVAVRRVAHPGPMEYVQIGAVLTAVTAVEVMVFYVEALPQALFAVILLSLSATKFMLVVLWFMHLKFDSRIFSTAFAAGFVLVVAVFFVVLATLGGNLV